MSSQPDISAMRRNLAGGEDKEDDKLGNGVMSTSRNGSSPLRDVIPMATSALCGVVFGIALEKGRVFEPQNIQGQMLFDKFIMLKMFLSAVTTSLVGLSALAMIPSTHRRWLEVEREFSCKFGTRGIMTSILGGAILGSGMTICGACPGMVLAQFGSGTTNAVLTLFGGLAGATVYGLLDSTIIPLLKPTRPWRVNSLHRYLQTPYFVLSLPLAAMMAVVVFGIELAVPWTTELDTPNLPGVGMFAMKSWPPYVAGILIGSLQIPLTVVVGDTLGSSSSFAVIASQIFRGPLKNVSPYLNNFKKGVWWQVSLISGVVLGAYMSSTASSSWGTTTGVSPTHSFIGGAAMIFGARLCAGCTSGHGLSGTGLLNLISFVTVPAMFGGGMATAFFMKAQGLI